MSCISQITNDLMISQEVGIISVDDPRSFLIAPYTQETQKILKCAIALICPITSIFIGIWILKNTFTTPSTNPFFKIFYTIIGCIATLGLGIIIVALQLIYTAITIPLIIISGKFTSLNSINELLIKRLTGLEPEYNDN